MTHCPQCDTLLEPGSLVCPSCEFALDERAEARQAPTLGRFEDDEVEPDASLGPPCEAHGLPIAGQCSRCGRDVCMRCAPDLNTSSQPRCGSCKPQKASEPAPARAPSAAAPRRASARRAAAEDLEDERTAVNPTAGDEADDGASLARVRAENARARRASDDVADEDQREGRPIGGFLTLVGVWLALKTAFMVVATPALIGVLGMLDNQVKAQRLGADLKEAVHASSQWLAAMTLLDTALLATLCWAFWTRRKLAIWMFLGHSILGIISAVTDAKDVFDGGFGVLWCIACIGYFVTSEQVEQTFVKG